MVRKSNRCRGIELGKTIEQGRRCGACKIRFCQNETVGKRHLLDRNVFTIERARAIYAIDRGHDAGQRDATSNARFGDERLEDGRRVGKAAGFDHDASEWRNLVAIAPLQQLLYGRDKVAADLAAEAPGRKLDEAVRARLHQLVVKADFAEFVDDDGRSREFPLAKQVTQQCRLAAAEKTGDDKGADHAGGAGRGAIRTRPAVYPGSSAVRIWRSTATSEIAPRLRPLMVTIQRNGKPAGAGSMRIRVAWHATVIASSFSLCTRPVKSQASRLCASSSHVMALSLSFTAPAR